MLNKHDSWGVYQLMQAEQLQQIDQNTTQQSNFFLAYLIVLDRYLGQGGSAPTLLSFTGLGSVHLVCHHLGQKVVHTASTHTGENVVMWLYSN